MAEYTTGVLNYYEMMDFIEHFGPGLVGTLLEG
jgi:hypothetical protein